MIGYISLIHGVHGNGMSSNASELLLRLFTVSPAMFPADTVTVDFIGDKSGTGILTVKLYYGTTFQDRAATPISGTLAATFPTVTGSGKFRLTTTLAKPTTTTLLKLGITGNASPTAGDIRNPRLILRAT